jgi:hypothetical protein
MTFYTTTDAQVAEAEELVRKLEGAAREIYDGLPPSYERELFITKCREASFWMQCALVPKWNLEDAKRQSAASDPSP